MKQIIKTLTALVMAGSAMCYAEDLAKDDFTSSTIKDQKICNGALYWGMSVYSDKTKNTEAPAKRIDLVEEDGNKTLRIEITFPTSEIAPSWSGFQMSNNLKTSLQGKNIEDLVFKAKFKSSSTSKISVDMRKDGSYKNRIFKAIEIKEAYKWQEVEIPLTEFRKSSTDFDFNSKTILYIQLSAGYFARGESHVVEMDDICIATK